MDEVQRFKKLKEKIDEISQNKIRIEERFKAEKEKLEALMKEIESKGYNPKELGTVKEQLEKELGTELHNLEEAIEGLSEKLSPMEGV